MEEFYRIERLPPYVFEQVNRAKAAARNAGADIIDLGMGNPDLPAPAHVIEKLKETLGKPRTDRYSASKGIPGLRRAQAAYYGRRFGVKLNPDTQVVATLGSKEGFANVAQAITAPGDVVLVPNPSYPIHAFGFLMAGGVIRSVPSEPTPEFFPALERAHHALDPEADRGRGLLSVEPDRVRRRASISTRTSSPSRRSTTSSSCPISPTPKSISTTIRRRRCCRCRARWTSRSSSPRCRRPIRWPAGAWALRSATSASSRRSARVKSYLDYGAFTPVQVAAAAALNGPDDCINEMRDDLHASAATCWSRASAAPAGRCRRRRPRCSPGRRSRSRSGDAGQRRILQALGREGRGRGVAGHRLRRARRGLSCASRWWRTSSASGRPPAISAASLKPAPETLHNVVPLATRR